MSTKRIILISGYARSGKDTLANALDKQLADLEPVRVKFANVLKNALQKALNDVGLGHIDVFTEDPIQKELIRPLFVEFGKYCRANDKDVFVRTAWRDISDLFYNGKGVVIVPDLRYSNEIQLISEWAKQLGWNVIHIRICRIGNQAANEEEMQSVCSLPNADAYCTFAGGDVDGIERWAKDLIEAAKKEEIRKSAIMGALARMEGLEGHHHVMPDDQKTTISPRGGFIDPNKPLPYLPHGNQTPPASKPWPNLIEAAKQGLPYELQMPPVASEAAKEAMRKATAAGPVHPWTAWAESEKADFRDNNVGVTASVPEQFTGAIVVPGNELLEQVLNIKLTLERMEARLKRLEVKANG